MGNYCCSGRDVQARNIFDINRLTTAVFLSNDEPTPPPSPPSEQMSSDEEDHRPVDTNKHKRAESVHLLSDLDSTDDDDDDDDDEDYDYDSEELKEKNEEYESYVVGTGNQDDDKSDESGQFEIEIENPVFQQMVYEDAPELLRTIQNPFFKKVSPDGDEVEMDLDEIGEIRSEMFQASKFKNKASLFKSKTAHETFEIRTGVAPVVE